MHQMPLFVTQFAELQQLVAEQIGDHADQCLTLVGGDALPRRDLVPMCQSLFQLIDFFVTKLGIRHRVGAAGTRFAHPVYSPHMTAVNDMPDSDQSAPHQ